MKESQRVEEEAWQYEKPRLTTVEDTPSFGRYPWIEEVTEKT